MKDQPSADPGWSVGPNGIDFDDLYLLEVRQIAKASLQPIIAYRPRVVMDSPIPSFSPYYAPPPPAPMPHTPAYHHPLTQMQPHWA